MIRETTYLVTENLASPVGVPVSLQAIARGGVTTLWVDTRDDSEAALLEVELSQTEVEHLICVLQRCLPPRSL